LSPVQALKKWQAEKPQLFVKRVYNQPGLDRLKVSLHRNVTKQEFTWQQTQNGNGTIDCAI
jgi:hypothetical protein